jgi:CheY-like chemotaxis protein
MSPTGRTETILVVDDDRMVLGLADSMLTRFGYTVVTAGNSDDALRLFENIKVDLTLVDLVMPKVSGVELVERIHELCPGLPVLFFSAYSEEDSSRPMFGTGVPFIAKPFTSLQLTQKIREVLDMPKANVKIASL